MPDQPFSVDRPLPEGVRDLLFADAATLRGMAASFRATWTAWGYREIILPTFEYAATLSTDVGAGLDAEMYRFFDRHGRTLALRPDMTIPTARVVGTRLYDQPKPLRLSYIGSVFRYEPPRAGRQHEFIQAGVELMGARGATADAESIALAVAALARSACRRFASRWGMSASSAGCCWRWPRPNAWPLACARRWIARPRRNWPRCCRKSRGRPPACVRRRWRSRA